MTYNLIFHLWRLLRKAIENNWIHSKSSRTGIILHFHQQPSDENLIINAKWDGVKRSDWDHVPAEFPTALLLGHHLGSLEMLLHPHEGEKGTELWLSTFWENASALNMKGSNFTSFKFFHYENSNLWRKNKIFMRPYVIATILKYSALNQTYNFCLQLLTPGDLRMQCIAKTEMAKVKKRSRLKV